MFEFSYVKAKSLADAQAFVAANPDAKLMAGGMTLIPTLKQRLAQPSHLVDIGGLPELRGIEVKAGQLVIGAATQHAEVATSPVVKKALPALAALANQIGDPQVRNRGTLGGSVANNDPAADYPAAVLALDATIVTNQREIAAADFFQGMFATALEGRGDRRACAFQYSQARRVREISAPGFGLRDGGRVRCRRRSRVARRRYRCRVGRVSLDRSGSRAGEETEPGRARRAATRR